MPPIYTSNLIFSIKDKIRQRNFQGVVEQMEGLSNKDFRRLSESLAKEILPSMPECFWDCFLNIVPAHPKAYLGTFLRAARQIIQQNKSANNEKFIVHPAFEQYAQKYANEIDKQKCMEILLPLCRSIDTAEYLLSHLKFDSERTAQILLHTGSSISYYLLFKYLRTIEDTPLHLRKYAIALLKKGDSLSFNLACMIQNYFDIPQLPATFSMNLPPHLLARMDSSYETFSKLLNN